jgi:hypothetical protein
MRYLQLAVPCIALTAFAGIAAGALRSGQESAPAPDYVTTSPSDVIALAKTDRLPLAPTAAIDDRWLAPVAEKVAYSDPVAQVPLPQMEPKKLTLNKSAKIVHPRDVCARHHMRKQITRGGRSWRCRR